MHYVLTFALYAYNYKCRKGDNKGYPRKEIMKQNEFIYKQMLCDLVDKGFWEVLRIRKYFINELLYTDYIDYTIDNVGDSNDLLNELYNTKGDYVTPKLARKVSLYYKAKNELISDIRFYLCKEYGITLNDELTKRMNKSKKKEGK